MRAMLVVLFALSGYVIGLANIAYIVGFLADYGVPKGISDGQVGNVWLAVAGNFLLVLAFGAHHSLTARSSFKRWWTMIVPKSLERTVYLYMTAAVTYLLVVFWQPIPIAIWTVEAEWGRLLLHGIYLTVLTLMFSATFHFGHLNFFGVAQAWHSTGKSLETNSGLTTRFLYGIIRHPIGAGWMIVPWLTPDLTVGHAVFGVASAVYIILATPFEEADLTEQLGDSYLDYKQKVPAFLPRLPFLK